MRRSMQLVLGGVAAALLFAATAQALTTQGVITGRSDVWYPAYGVDTDSGDAFLAFTQYTKAGHAGAWYRENDASKARLNLTGSGWTWGLDPTTKTIPYQVATGSNSDIKLFDWSTDKRHGAGAIVNDPARWEYQPSLSGTSLLFGRLNAAARPDVRRLFLYDTQSQQRTLLDTFVGNRAAGMLWVGQVNGDWAVWETDHYRVHNDTVYRYQISTGLTEPIPHPDTRLDYAVSVGPDGTMYFIRSRFACGAGVRLRSVDTSGRLTTLYDVPAGRDVSKTFAVANDDGSTTIYYDSWRCADPGGNGNIYKVTIPAAGGTITSAASSDNGREATSEAAKRRVDTTGQTGGEHDPAGSG